LKRNGWHRRTIFEHFGPQAKVGTEVLRVCEQSRFVIELSENAVLRERALALSSEGCERTVGMEKVLAKLKSALNAWLRQPKDQMDMCQSQSGIQPLFPPRHKD
jgi:hypothetical protein